jgi:hypothetical protein
MRKAWPIGGCFSIETNKRGGVKFAVEYGSLAILIAF